MVNDLRWQRSPAAAERVIRFGDASTRPGSGSLLGESWLGNRAKFGGTPMCWASHGDSRSGLSLVRSARSQAWPRLVLRGRSERPLDADTVLPPGSLRSGVRVGFWLVQPCIEVGKGATWYGIRRSRSCPHRRCD